MGRYPFLTEFHDYLEAVKPYYRPSSLQRMAINLGTIHQDLQALHAKGRVSTTSPGNLTEEDLGALIHFWQNRPARGPNQGGRPGARLDQATWGRYLSDLQGFLEWRGNGVVAAIKRKHRFPRPAKGIRVLNNEELERLRAAAEAVTGWTGVTARFMVAFLPATGLRRKEFRLARLQDLDTQRWRVTVTHPKGEGSWASIGQRTLVLSFARPAVLDFLQERAAWLSKLGLDPDHVEPLVPQIHQWTGGNPRETLGPVTYYSDAMLWKVKAEVEERAGINFALKIFRATFAQLAKDAGVPIEAVSKALRHRTTRTTELYYARISDEDAFAEFERAFSKPRVGLLDTMD